MAQPSPAPAGECLFLGSDSGTTLLLKSLVHGLSQGRRPKQQNRQTESHLIHCQRADGHNFHVRAWDPHDQSSARDIIAKLRPPLIILNVFIDNYQDQFVPSSSTSRSETPTIVDWISLVKETPNYHPYYLTVLNGCDELDLQVDLDLAMGVIKSQLYQFLPHGTLPIIIPTSTVTYGGIRYDPYCEDNPQYAITLLGMITKFFYWSLSEADTEQWTVLEVDEEDTDNDEPYVRIEKGMGTDGAEATIENVTDTDQCESEAVADVKTATLEPGNDPGDYIAISRFLLIGDISECIMHE